MRRGITKYEYFFGPYSRQRIAEGAQRSLDITDFNEQVRERIDAT